jgi:hypothetical protein
MGKEWFELMWESNPKLMQRRRIIVPRISNANHFAVEDGKYYGNTEVYSIVLDEEIETKYELEFILGVLNSKVIEFFLKSISPILSGRYYRYDKQFLGQLPVRLPSNSKEEKICKEIATFVKRILGLNEALSRNEEKIQEFPYSYLDAANWSFDKLANLSKAINLSETSYGISSKSLRTDYLLRDLDGKETFRVILSTNEYVDFSSEETASYVLEVLKTMKRVTRGEILDLRIPQKPHLKELFGSHRRDVAQLEKDKHAIAELERRIDELVFSLYDMNYTEQRIIEDYLNRFR